jgi:hypothetical protein
MEVVGRSGGVLNEGDPKGGAPTLQVEIPTVSATTSTRDPSVGEECHKAALNTVVGADTRSVDLKAARILPEVVAATWEVHQLWEILLTASRMPGYCDKPVTQKRSSHV